MNKKFLGLVLSLAVLSLVACGNKEAKLPEESTVQTQVVTVAASPVPHAELLVQVMDDMKALGYD